MTLNPRIKMGTNSSVITIIQEAVKEEKSVGKEKLVRMGRLVQSI